MEDFASEALTQQQNLALTSLNTFKLVESGAKQAVQITVEVPPGFCWEDIGRVALSAALHRISRPQYVSPFGL